jgi:hypothetical protein
LSEDELTLAAVPTQQLWSIARCPFHALSLPSTSSRTDPLAACCVFAHALALLTVELTSLCWRFPVLFCHLLGETLPQSSRSPSCALFQLQSAPHLPLILSPLKKGSLVFMQTVHHPRFNTLKGFEYFDHTGIVHEQLKPLEHATARP